MDIANLDGVVMLGFPGSVASLWQQAGRGGRTADADALAVLIASPSPIDQWVMRHPQATLEMAIEPSIVDVANPMVLEQVACAMPAVTSMLGRSPDPPACPLVLAASRLRGV